MIILRSKLFFGLTDLNPTQKYLKEKKERVNSGQEDQWKGTQKATTAGILGGAALGVGLTSAAVGLNKKIIGNYNKLSMSDKKAFIKDMGGAKNIRAHYKNLNNKAWVRGKMAKNAGKFALIGGIGLGLGYLNKKRQEKKQQQNNIN